MFVTSQVEAPHPLDSLSPFDCSGTDEKRFLDPRFPQSFVEKKRRSNLKKHQGPKYVTLSLSPLSTLLWRPGHCATMVAGFGSCVLA